MKGNSGTANLNCRFPLTKSEGKQSVLSRGSNNSESRRPNLRCRCLWCLLLRISSKTQGPGNEDPQDTRKIRTEIFRSLSDTPCSPQPEEGTNNRIAQHHYAVYNSFPVSSHQVHHPSPAIAPKDGTGLLGSLPLTVPVLLALLDQGLVPPSDVQSSKTL